MRLQAEGRIDLSTPCQLWAGCLTRDGYGIVGHHGSAHREAFAAAYGSVPAGLQIDHVCHNADPECSGGPLCVHRRCVNPLHLEAVTPRENQLRGKSFSAANARKTHCPAGHPYDEANTYRYSRPGDSRRCCRACIRAASRLRDQRRRAAQA